jgi:hypothetical protein
MRSCSVLCAIALLAGAPQLGAAEQVPERVPAEPAERRSGFMLGMAGGLLTSSARGYPNDLTKIGVAEYHASTGVGVSTGGSFWLGGALADWLNVGIGLSGGSMQRNGVKGGGGAFNLRMEFFPLFYRGGPFQDLGVLLTAGTGGYSIERGKQKLAEGAGTSAVGIGAFYEPWRFWLLSFGPQLEYTHLFSDSLSAHQLVIGVRTVFYGGP